MPGNSDPIFTRVGDVSSDGTASTTSAMGPTLTTAAADYTGISANNKVAFTADATNGSYIQRLRFKANSSSNNVASVARIYINNGGSAGTATNNTLIDEVNLPATTASANSATPTIEWSAGYALPPGFRILVGLGTTVAGGWQVTGIGGKY